MKMVMRSDQWNTKMVTGSDKVLNDTYENDTQE